jgi:hypothetical protein
LNLPDSLDHSNTSTEGAKIPTKELPNNQKNLNYLSRVWDIRTSDAIDEGALVFMARCFIQATLPHSNPGDNEDIWLRRNGHYKLEILAGRYKNEMTGKTENIGLPYGSIPRLLMIWMTTEALRTKSQQLFLGKSLSSFMEKLGLSPRGGKRGDITRLKNQAYKLFRSEFTLTQEQEQGRKEKDMKISSERVLFWNCKTPEQSTLWESYVILTPEFFDSITYNPAPMDMRALKALKASSMALDMYMWLSHRTFYLTTPQKLPWEALEAQMGSDYKELKIFRHYIRKAVNKIKVFWPELNADFDNPEVITLYPSKSLISPKEARQGKLLFSR